mmetsp:Transcript_7830/g.11982  ORF Transcript_7830/g.11982 Transcript_7830/m.11982 type:complete len:711 (+) Transcript_7830:138-2270(+)
MHSNRDKKIRVLVCTANLGNSCPNLESIAALIPEDGCISEVCDSPNYPVPTVEEENKLREEMGLQCFTDNGFTLDYVQGEENSEQNFSTSRDHFDIIVCGFQEATFTECPEHYLDLNTNGLFNTDITPRTSVIQSVKKDIHTVKKFFKTRDHLNGPKQAKQANPSQPQGHFSDSNVMGSMLQNRCPSYDFSVRYQRGEMRLEVLVRKGLDVETISVNAQNTGVLNAANKGGISAELIVEKFTRLAFCTAHLQAHEGKDHYQQRCQMTSSILQGTAPQGPLHLDLSLTSHLTFFLGDLNFRTDLEERELAKEEHIEKVHQLVEEEKWKELNKADELFKALKHNDCLVGFRTLPCLFPPTFKVERKKGLSYLKQRRPSYTDRILWKGMHDMGSYVKPLAYEPILDFSTSDHKPLRGAFEIKLNNDIKVRNHAPRERNSMIHWHDNKSYYEREVPSNANLHLFISDLECNLKEKKGSTPDPFIVFVSNPRELIHLKPNRWQAFASNVRKEARVGLGINSRRKVLLHGTGFPRTKCVHSTYQPQWDGETHLVIKMEEQGNQIDLSGAMLFFVVMDQSLSIENKIIGTFSLNLANLSMAIPSQLGDESDTNQPARLNAMLNRFIRPTMSVRHRRSNTMVHSDPRNISLKFQQHLTKNGKHVGWISFTVCCKWLTNLAVPREITKRRLRRIKKRKKQNESELSLSPLSPSVILSLT